MKLITKIFIIVICVFMFSCNKYAYIMHSTPIQYYTFNEIDSICMVYDIPMVPSNWIFSMYIDELTNTPINQYTFITKTNETEKTYICTQIDSVYRFNIRTLKKIKK